MKKTIGIYFLLGLFLVINSCKLSQFPIPNNNDLAFISQDKLGNIYQINDMQISQYSIELDTIQTNSIYSNGLISSLDTRNPLQLMLFYKQQQAIILLDNTLSQTNKISLSEEFDWIGLACLSNRDNAFWLYSNINQELIKTDKNTKVIDRYKNIGQLLQKDINPTQLIEYANFVYLFDPSHGLFQFDLYGNYVKRIQLENAEKIKFFQNKVLYQVGTVIYSYHLVSFDKKEEYRGNDKFEDFVFNEKGVVLLENKSIFYKYF